MAEVASPPVELDPVVRPAMLAPPVVVGAEDVGEPSLAEGSPVSPVVGVHPKASASARYATTPELRALGFVRE